MRRATLLITVFAVAIAAGTMRSVPCATAHGETYSWQKPHAKVLPTGDLEWAPEPFAYEPGQAVRYVDFAEGDDNNAGRSPDAAWKHHPWDPDARGKARAGAEADTYVFKGGVTYRGRLRVPDGASAHLTCDPSWGNGRAWLAGSQAVGTGWRKEAHPKMPEPDEVWAAEIDFLPRNAWTVDAEGNVTRLRLARTPNWEPSDPENRLSEWWTWKQPQWWKQFSGNNPNLMTVRGKKFHLGIDPAHLKDIGRDAVGGYVWTEFGIPTGNDPYPAKIQDYDPKKGGIAFGGPWFDGPGAMIFAGHRYYLEDRPQWLDEDGEFWFDRKGNGGTLYVRLPKGQTPSALQIEAARQLRIIDGGDVGTLRISNLGFRFTNVLWDYSQPQFGDPDVQAGVIRLFGGGELVQVDHCRFEHVHLPLRAEAPGGKTLRLVRFTDNDIEHGDQGVCEITDRPRARDQKGKGILTEVHVLRNRLHLTGMRGARGRYNGSIRVKCARMSHVAGNIAHQTASQAIEIFGGKLNGEDGEWPFSRQIVHHNKSIDSMMQASDWAGIEMWQGGPFYVFNNHCGAPQGLMSWSEGGKGRRFGFAYYLDGGFKGFVFNNIAWARYNQPDSPLGSKAAFQTVLGFQNSYFNNSVHKFQFGWHRQSPAGGRNKYLGNIVQDISVAAMQHAHPAKDPKAVNAGHFMEGDVTDYATNAYGLNVFHDVAAIGVYQVEGLVRETIEGFVSDLKTLGYTGTPDPGVVVETLPMPHAEKQDFRPAPGSGVDGRGAKVFIPWALSAVVGEWHFTPNSKDPGRIVDEHWYMTKAYDQRDKYSTTPRYPLTRQGGTFVSGDLENWCDGALELNKQDMLTVSNERLTKPYKIPVARQKKGTRAGQVIQGADKPTVDMQDNSFVIEAYLRTQAGSDTAVLAGKTTGQAGYALHVDAAGKPVLTLRRGGDSSTLTGSSGVADGTWHHLLAEVDRSADRVRLYVDGRLAGEGKTGLPAGASLSNEADFVVAKDLACTLDFLRVARGTLADAHTTIDELRAWQFDGPQLRDFAGRPPSGDGRDAGALEAE